MQPPGAFGLMYGSGWRRSHSRRSPSAMSRSMRSGSWTWRYCSNAARHFSAYARACVCVCVRMAARVCACARACAAWHLGLGNGAAACEAQVRAQGARAPRVEACRPDGLATAVARTRVPGRVRLTATARHDAARAPRANSTRTEKGGDTPRHIRARAHRRRCAHVHSCMCTCARTCASPRARALFPSPSMLRSPRAQAYLRAELLPEHGPVPDGLERAAVQRAHARDLSGTRRRGHRARRQCARACGGRSHARRARGRAPLEGVGAAVAGGSEGACAPRARSGADACVSCLIWMPPSAESKGILSS